MTEIFAVYLFFSWKSFDDGSVSITSWPNVKTEIEMTVERQTQTLMNRTWEQTQLQLNSFCCENNSFIHLPRQFSLSIRDYLTKLYTKQLMMVFPLEWKWVKRRWRCQRRWWWGWRLLISSSPTGSLSVLTFVFFLFLDSWPIPVFVSLWFGSEAQ